jgi:ABC-2 type transport system ATP-binding protein
MNTSIVFEQVSKTYTLAQIRTLKDWVLGVRGHRPRPITVDALSDVSFSVEEGDTLALLGHNGSGKSTALKLLAGILAPSSGTIRARGLIAPLLEVGSGFHPDLTGRENVYLKGVILGISRAEIRRRFNEIVDFAEIEEFIDLPVRFYSSGMMVRLGFSIAVNVSPDILLLDEVLAVGDASFQEKSRARLAELRKDGRTIILVTHNMQSAQDFCRRAVVLDHGRVTFDGLAIDATTAFLGSSRST